MFSSGAHSLPLDATGAVVCTFKRRGQLCHGAPSATSLRTRSQPPGTYGRLVRRKVHREDAGATQTRIQRRSQAAPSQPQQAPLTTPSHRRPHRNGRSLYYHHTNQRWQTLVSDAIPSYANALQRIGEEDRGYRLSISGPPLNCDLLFASCKRPLIKNKVASMIIVIIRICCTADGTALRNFIKNHKGVWAYKTWKNRVWAYKT